MKKIIFFVVLTGLISCQDTPPITENVVTSDIDHFWEAYDKIRSTQDSAQQYQYLQEFYLNKGSEGLQRLLEVRNYQPSEYIEAINNMPKFWESIRQNTYKSKELSPLLQKSADQLKELYPAMQPAKIYFAIGAFRTNATVTGDKVLVGCEMLLTDEHTVTEEFPESITWAKNYFASNPINGVDFLMAHEFVHTQQVSSLGGNLLQHTVREGFAEFIGELSSGIPSNTPAVAYGKEHEEALREAFLKDMFKPYTSYWLWSSRPNPFQQRDLGYAIGYTMAKGYYENATDKSLAIKEMIELDYSQLDSVASIVDQSGYFSKPIKELQADYNAKRPSIVKVTGVNNNKTNSTGLKTVTLHFSEPMNKARRGFDYGPLGADHVLRVQNVQNFSEDGKSMQFDVNLAPGKHYQLMISPNFESATGYGLQPYLIDIITK